MKTNLHKRGQVSPPATPPSPATPPPVTESTFTISQYQLSLAHAKQVFNKLNSIGLVSTDTPQLLSGLLNITTGILSGNVGGSYLSNQMSLGIKDMKKTYQRSVVNIDDVKSAFSSRVLSKVESAFTGFENFKKYSLEIVEPKTPKLDTAKTAEYDALFLEITNSTSARELKSHYEESLNYLSEITSELTKVFEVDFSVINQVLNLPSASGIGLSVSGQGTKQIVIDYVPASFKNSLLEILKVLMTASYLIEGLRSSTGNASIASSISISGTKKTQQTAQQQTQGTQPVASSGLRITSVIPGNSFVQSRGVQGISLQNVTASSVPSFSILIQGLGSGTQSAHTVLLNLIRSRLMSIADPSTITNPAPDLVFALTSIREILTNPNANGVNLSIAKNPRSSGHKLSISMANNISLALSHHPGVEIFKFLVNNNQPFNVTAKLDRYYYEDNFSKFSFSAKELINDSSNISKINRQKILEKIKK